MASITFAASGFAPVALGFFGLGTGYLILGPQELFGWPNNGGRALARSNGVWGFFMPGLCQALVGLYLFVGLSWFESFKEAQLYSAAVAFSVFGIHWLAMGLIKFVEGDARPNGFMSVAFFLVSVLGVISFAIGGDAPVAVLFIGLAAVYFFEFFASFGIAVPATEKLLGLAHTVTGFYLMYLTYGIVLSTANDVNILF
ncbi:MAG: hypothetical protein CMP08_06870 [Xanthomonadales bacterium]|nr:hypothetical protein [Xanthomonadales bacterium]